VQAADARLERQLLVEDPDDDLDLRRRGGLRRDDLKGAAA
jgi:hypothetical protein